MLTKGVQFLHLACQRGGSSPRHPVNYATGNNGSPENFMFKTVQITDVST